MNYFDYFSFFQGTKVFLKHPHTCVRSEAENLVAKSLYELREIISYGDVSSVGREFQKTVAALKEAGVDDSLIPTFAQVKSSLYKNLKKRTRSISGSQLNNT